MRYENMGHVISFDLQDGYSIRCNYNIYFPPNQAKRANIMNLQTLWRVGRRGEAVMN